MTRTKMIFASMLLVLGLAFSCGEDKEEPVETPVAPALTSVSPAEGATGIDISSPSVVFTYDQNVKVSSSNMSKVTVDKGATVESVNAYSNTVTVKLSGLAYETTYTVSIASGAVEGYKTNQPGASAAKVSFTTVDKPEEDTDVDPEDDDNLAWQMMKKLGLGFDLGNQMDAYDGNGVANETAWGNPKVTQTTFDKLKSYGFSSVRIPVTWLGHIGEAPDYKIEEAWLARVEEIVGYAEKAGLYAIVNTHHDEENGDGHWLSVKNAAASTTVKEQITAELKALWTQIANRFKDKGDFLIFEPFNELQDGGWGYSDAFKKNPTAQTNIINEWNQVFVDAVRATGGNNANRWLGIAGYAASSTFTIKYLELPKDSAKDRLMVGFHCYDPYSYCIARENKQWGHTRKTDLGNTSLNEDTLLEVLKPYYNKYVSKGIPVYIGEFGCVNRNNSTEQAFQKYYLEYFVKAARTYGMPAFLWDNGVAYVADGASGEPFGFVNHGTGEYIGQGSTLVPVMVKAMTNNDSNYTLDTVYASAPK